MIEIPKLNVEDDIIEQTFGQPQDDQLAKQVFADLPTPKSKMHKEINEEKSAIQVTSATGQQRKRIKKIGDKDDAGGNEGKVKPSLGVGETPIEAQNLASYFEMMQVNKDPQATAKFKDTNSGSKKVTPGLAGMPLSSDSKNSSGNQRMRSMKVIKPSKEPGFNNINEMQKELDKINAEEQGEKQ